LQLKLRTLKTTYFIPPELIIQKVIYKDETITFDLESVNFPLTADVLHIFHANSQNYCGLLKRHRLRRRAKYLAINRGPLDNLKSATYPPKKIFLT